MKLPDITLFFQMANFILAYWALRRFIFAPALIIIENQEQKNQFLTAKVQNARTQLKENLEQQQQRWSFIRQSLMSMAPCVNLQRCLCKFKVTSSIEVTKTQISEVEKDSIQKMLNEKLLDVS
jgi:hypothetical protein